MEFLELAKSRYSCRKFLEKPVEQEKIDKILEAGRIAPTAVNFQPQRILVLTDKEKLKKVCECTKYSFNAPLNFIVCYDKEESWKRGYDGKDHGDIDASIIASHMMLEAWELGIGSTWVGSFNPKKAAEIFGIPENYEITAFLPMGYPAEDSKPAPMHEKRLDIKDIADYNNFK